MSIKTFSVRIDTDILHKLHIVAAYEGRSMNGQLLVLIRQCINTYETSHGTIPIHTSSPKR